MSRRMFGYIGGSTTIFSSKCKPLYGSQREYQDGSKYTDRIIIGNESNGKRRSSHDEQCDEKGILPANEITQSSEDNSAEGTNNEAYTESSQCSQERSCR